MTGRRKAKAKPEAKAEVKAEAVKIRKPVEVTGYNEAQIRRLSKFQLKKGGK